jgi:hypothetical protein
MSAPTQTRIATRPSNADKHPGDQVPKRKRRTKLEMAEARALEAEAIEQKKNEEQAKIDRIAALEDKMADEDASSKQLTRRPVPRPLRRASAHLQLLMTADDVDSAENESLPASDWQEIPEDVLADLTDNENDQPKKKKAKASAREKINAARKAPTSGQEGVSSFHFR